MERLREKVGELKDKCTSRSGDNCLILQIRAATILATMDLANKTTMALANNNPMMMMIKRSTAPGNNRTAAEAANRLNMAQVNNSLTVRVNNRLMARINRLTMAPVNKEDMALVTNPMEADRPTTALINTAKAPATLEAPMTVTEEAAVVAMAKDKAKDKAKASTIMDTNLKTTMVPIKPNKAMAIRDKGRRMTAADRRAEANNNTGADSSTGASSSMEVSNSTVMTAITENKALVNVSRSLLMLRGFYV